MGRSWQLASLVLGFCVWLAGEQAAPPSGGAEPGLLFYLSASLGLVADYSAGRTPEPNFASDVTIIAAGREIAHAGVPSLEAPVDLRPRTATVRLALPAGARVTRGSVTVEIRGTIHEITTKNNEVRF
jgi:hypothetical protein